MPGARIVLKVGRAACGVALTIIAIPEALAKPLPIRPAAETTMDDEKFDRLSQLYTNLGTALLELVGTGRHHVLVYAEAERGGVTVSVFRKEGRRVVDLEPTGEIAGLVADIWMIEPPRKRWAALEFELTGTKFNARMAYPEDFVSGDSDEDRSAAAIRRVFGNGAVMDGMVS